MPNLAAQVLFPTPQTTDAPDGGGPPNKNANTTQWNGANSLGQMAKQGLWPTPKQSDYKGSGPTGSKSQVHDDAKRNLKGDSRLWRTPDSYDRGGPQDPEKRKEGGHSVNLQDQAGGQLNPEFVCYLMGVPQGWVSLEPLDPEHWQRWLTEDHWAAGEWEGVPRVATGIKDRVNQLKMLGNGIVPAVPAMFLRLLGDRR